MKRLISIITSVLMLLTMTASSIYGASASSVPYLPGNIEGKALALDLYHFNSSQPAASVSGDAKSPDTPIETVAATNPVEALVHNYERLEGECVLTENSRIFIDSLFKPSSSLYNTAQIASKMLAEHGVPSKNKLKVTYGPRMFARTGDIIISCKSSERSFKEYAVPQESYEMYVNDRVTILSCDSAGAYYGLITLMQLAADNEIVPNLNSKTEARCLLPSCMISDGPELIERTMFLDCARKYFSVDWIKNLIKRSSMQRYNTLELHFSEAEGTRVESEVFPWLTAGNKALSRDEVREIVSFAQQYHMDIIPSIDVPGHTQYIVQQYAKYVKKHPNWSFEYNGKKYDKSIPGFGTIANHYSFNGETKDADYIGYDLTQEHAVAFMDALIDDYAAFFRELGCNRINISGDELLGWYTFNLGGQRFSYENRWQALEHWDNYAKVALGIKHGSASDTFINYLNTLASRLEEQGYRVRVFNDEINLNKNQHIKLNPTIELNYWTGLPGSPMSYAQDGHYMYNDVSKWNFYVVKHKNGGDIMTNDFKSVNTKNIYKNWNPKSLSSKKDKVRLIPEEQLGGGYFHIWCDHPDYKDATTIWNETGELTWCNGTKMWNPEITDSLNYDSFMKFVGKM